MDEYSEFLMVNDEASNPWAREGTQRLPHQENKKEKEMEMKLGEIQEDVKALSTSISELRALLNQRPAEQSQRDDCNIAMTSAAVGSLTTFLLLSLSYSLKR